MLDSLYGPLLTLHHWLAWLVLLCAILAVARAALGFGRRLGWRKVDDTLGRVLAISIDLQVLAGILLWVQNFNRSGLDMANASSRQMLLEHPLAMLAALALVHIGRARVRRQETDRGRFRTALIFNGLALILIAALIPWERLGL